jgi:hypothetical protein
MLVKMVINDPSELPQISDERFEEIRAFKDADISDCPELTPEQMAQFRPGRYRPLEATAKTRSEVKKTKLAS